MATTLSRRDSKLYTHTLPNGLQMLGQYIPGVQSAAAVFWVCTGTRDEPPGEMGVSHFLEHMAFRRTRRMTGDEIDRAFEEMGADHNAGTWLEMTFFWVRVLSENVAPSLELLADLTHPILDAGDFDHERDVILEEIARYEDMPAHILFAMFMQDYFRNHPLARETLGTPETIKALTVAQMQEYWNRRYGTRNMIFAVSGNFDWDAVVDCVGRVSATWAEGESERTLVIPVFTPGVHVYQRDQFVQEQIAIGTPSVKRSDPRYFAAALLSTILGDDTGSRLFWSVQQTGLAESVSAGSMEFDDTGLMLVHLATEPGLAAKALAATQAEMQRLQDFDVRQDELDRARAKLQSAVVIGGESTNERVMGLIRSWLAEGELETLEDIRRKIDAVTLDDLRSLVRDYPLSPQQVITAVGPLAEEELTVSMG